MKPHRQNHEQASLLAMITMGVACALLLFVVPQLTSVRANSSSRQTSLKELYSQMKEGVPFSTEERRLLLKANNGETISDIEADTTISRVLYHRYVEGRSLNADQKALLNRYKKFAGQNGQALKQLEGKSGSGQSNGFSELLPSGGTTLCESAIFTQSTAAIVPGTTDTGNHCDDCTTLIALPFPYILYDQTFTTARVSSNGNLQFGSNNDDLGGCLPQSFFSYTIFAFYGDLLTNGSAAAGIFTSVSGVAPNRIFNIEWRTRFCCSSGPNTQNFEIRLYENSRRFDIIYGQLDNTGSFVSVGVQQDTSCFTRFECFTAGTLFNGLLLGVTFPPAFDICVQDDSNRTLLKFNSNTGAYVFQDCRKGTTLSGTGVVQKNVQNDFCKVSLFDTGPDPKRPDRNVQALVNTCTKKGNASVTISSSQMFTINDSNITNNTCACQ